MDRYTKSRNRRSNNLRMKASSLYFLNDISNIDSTDGLNATDNWRDEYTFSPAVIGRGHFSKVYKVKCCTTGNTYAIKAIRRRRLGTDKIDEIMQEIEIMQMINKSSNPGFIQLLKVHTSPSDVAIVMEFASGGALYHVTQESRTGLPEVYVRIILTKVLSALSVLHLQNIVHLDIKADNILLRHPYPSTDVVLTDFGLARKLIKSKVHKEMIGTPDYIAPEVINYEQICLRSDMWSVGVLTYFILTNVSPFSGISKDDTLHKVTKAEYVFVGKLKEETLHQARSFISALLIKLPEKRLTTEECLSHDFLSNVNIIEYSQEKSPGLVAPVINLEHQIQVRANSSFRLRGMAMSQCDINSLHMNDSENDLLNSKSAENLEIIKTSLTNGAIEKSSDNIKVSINSVDQATEDFIEKEELVEDDNTKECYKDMEEIEGMIESIRKNRKVNNVSLTVKNEDDKEDIESVTNIQLINNNYENVIEDTEDLSLSTTDNTNNSLSEMTTSCFEPASVNINEYDNIIEKSTSESYSILLKDESCKENDLPEVYTSKEIFNSSTSLQRAETYEPRKRCNENNKSKSNLKKCSLINESFRNSRENILDYNRNDKEQYMKIQRMKSCNTIDPNDYNTGTLKSMNGAVKRRVLSKSIKRDSDKPQKLLECNRRSELITSIDYLADLSPDYKCNISASNPILNISSNESKNKFDIFNMFKKKKPKELTKSKSACLIS